MFGNLHTSDLKIVGLVSKQWKSVADAPALWAGFQLPEKCKENEIDFFQFFKGSLSSKLQHLGLNHFNFQLNDDHFKNFMNLHLNSITIGPTINLSLVSGENLAKLVNNCRECEISIYDDESN